MYTKEKHIQVLLALLKKHGIRKVIASPGSSNTTVVASMQNDPYFEMYSAVDERSAAYMACGLALESSEPVILSCTGATASRNYMPGLTEAYYRKLPILAITSTPSISKVGHHMAQVIDRSILPKDVAKLSVTLPLVKDQSDFWECEMNVNKAILELLHDGGGPVHINLTTTYNKSYETKELPEVRVIKRITGNKDFPDFPKGKIAVFIGSHKPMTNEQTEILDNFCASNNAIVLCDHTSNYKGKYRVLFSLVASQQMFDKTLNAPYLVIHIGEITGDYYSIRMTAAELWRVNEDGEVRDTYGKLKYVFKMPEVTFFEHYTTENTTAKTSYLQSVKSHVQEINSKIPDLPFSNIWIASKMADRLPENSRIHFGILNSLRSWNFFEIPNTVLSSSNVGGFGIDGNMSTLIGASLANKDRLCFGVIGDLAFFYDMNVIGNRHVGNNLRILLVNNGMGTEFKQYNHNASHFGEAANDFIAASGHFGNKSTELVKNYAESLGFEYMSSNNKKSFELCYERFLVPDIKDKSIIFEVFTESSKESEALELIQSIEKNVKGKISKMAKQILGQKNINSLKKLTYK